MVQDAEVKTGVPSSLIAAVMKVEDSSFNPNAKSGAGAIGMMQLMPGTAKELGVNPNDPQQNILGGTKYLGQLLKQFGSTELALAAYNAGAGRVNQAIKNAGSRDWETVKKYLPNETQNYVPKVFNYMGG